MVSDPQEVDLRLVAIGHGASEHQRVVGQSESVTAAAMSHRRKSSGCGRKDGEKKAESLLRGKRNL